MKTPSLSVVLAGGGTAGHISPLLAIARAIRTDVPDARILAVGTAAGMETRLVPAAGFELATIERVPLPRRPSLDLFKLPFKFGAAVRQARRIIEGAGADVVVGVGGYVSTPMYIAARQANVPIVIHEANARPGLANRVGARLTDHVAVAFQSTKLPDAVWVGMPMRTEISSLDRGASRTQARERLGLEPDKPTLIVTGGSSGAASINRTVSRSLHLLADAGIRTLHITGRGKQLLDPAGVPVTAPAYRQVEYVDGMEDVYAAADLLLARAGAATVCEVAAVGLPAVLVPLPHGNGEQALNAADLVAAGGAVLVRDQEFTAEWVAGHVPALLQDPAKLEAMSAAGRSLGIRDADQRMAKMVQQAAGEGDR
ncbi:undecaprenyldiphospho-muramoylpentapeptide beta-N- acetylglucosaminyltransferase [Arthrobacter crystallopoietes BAB-32]|uniref:UDP-N-acetylglucosamine--N-acetylmuramyl-(pentapeptide) pyrophosphoryl-undecaprenol N-acetylglucosamine transferase n=1 Tax=Arthrobacter crystallopoietes BAB-32 TaxID=1246476 RepID=N1V0L1_9MICC|nr:undecaprenyldiphospho-muramoylpentapeptide beta-N-acetylglucosaminyltransferase [Arthrobacter crystallopoietes]EMY33617.1 undecaprenyldiphospho-muramoylpentapeptide beta-N- acetylglucosaminyltransferase [Arthrobacter crystallopoietes BAB-32]